MLTRVITSVVALAVFAAVIAAPPMVFQCAVGIIIIAMLYECVHIMTKSVLVKAAGIICGGLIAAGAVMSDVLPFATFTVTIFMIITVFMHRRTDYKEIFSVGFMTLYISIFMSCASLMCKDFGIVPTLIIFICAWSTDTGAYFAGSLFGKHKLIPHVSPKKTVEGAIGGIFSAMLCCMIYMFIITLMGMDIVGLSGFAGYAVIGGVGIIVSAISQLGDLVASAVKRDCGVKDYGKIFPGHGGFMDRFDSVIIIAPLIYYIIRMFAA